MAPIVNKGQHNNLNFVPHEEFTLKYNKYMIKMESFEIFILSLN